MQLIIISQRIQSLCMYTYYKIYGIQISLCPTAGGGNCKELLSTIMLQPTAGKHELHPTRTYRSFTIMLSCIYLCIHIYRKKKHVGIKSTYCSIHAHAHTSQDKNNRTKQRQILHTQTYSLLQNDLESLFRCF